MKLNIGAGDSNYQDYIRIDYDPNTNPDYLVDLEKDSFPFEDNTVTRVIAHHILEHLGDGYFHCLKELYRVCSHGAIIDIRVPHPRHDSFLADPTHKRPIIPMGLKLFSKKFNQLSKEKGFASSRLGDYYGVDFEIVEYKYVPDQDASEVLSTMTQAELEVYANQHNNIISEIQIKLVVVKDESQ